MNWKNLWQGIRVKFKESQDFRILTVFVVTIPVWLAIWVLHISLRDEMNWILAVFMFFVYTVLWAVASTLIYLVAAWTQKAWDYLKDVERTGEQANNK